MLKFVTFLFIAYILPYCFCNTTELCLSTCTSSCQCPLDEYSRICSNHGICQDGKCQCTNGYDHFFPFLSSQDNPTSDELSLFANCNVLIMEILPVLRICILIIAIVTCSIAFVCSGFYIYYRKHPALQCYRLIFGHFINSCIVIGSIATTISIYLRSQGIACTIVSEIEDICTTAVMGTLFSKTYRNYRVLQRSTKAKAQPLKISDGYVFRMISIAVLIEFALSCLLVYCVINSGSMFLGIYFTGMKTSFVSPERNLELSVSVILSRITYIQWPEFKHEKAGFVDHRYHRFHGCAYPHLLNSYLTPYKAALCIAASVLAYRARNFPLNQINESLTSFTFTFITLAVWTLSAYLYFSISEDLVNVLYVGKTLSTLFPYMSAGLSLLLPKILKIQRFDKYVDESHTSRHAYQLSFNNKSFNGQHGDLIVPLPEKQYPDGHINRLLRKKSSETTNSTTTDTSDYFYHVDWRDVQKVEESEQYIARIIEEEKGFRFEIHVVLLLLSSFVQHRKIRGYAASAIEQYSDMEYMLYLPQYLQALKHEPGLLYLKDLSPPESQTAQNGNNTDDPSCWENLVKCDQTETSSIDVNSFGISNGKSQACSTLLDVIVRKSLMNEEIARKTYWEILLEIQSSETFVQIESGIPSVVHREKSTKPIYIYVLSLLKTKLSDTSEGQGVLTVFQTQCRVLAAIRKFYSHIRSQTADYTSNTAFLRKLLSSADRCPEELCVLKETNAVHPLHPEILIRGVEPDESAFFRSATHPLKLVFVIDMAAQREAIEKAMEKEYEKLKTGPLVLPKMAKEGSMRSKDFKHLNITIETMLHKSMRPILLSGWTPLSICSIQPQTYVEYQVSVKIRKIQGIELKTMRRCSLNSAGEGGGLCVRIECNGNVQRANMLRIFERSTDAFAMPSSQFDEIIFVLGSIPKEIDFYVFYSVHTRQSFRSKKKDGYMVCRQSIPISKEHQDKLLQNNEAKEFYRSVCQQDQCLQPSLLDDTQKRLRSSLPESIFQSRGPIVLEIDINIKKTTSLPNRDKHAKEIIHQAADVKLQQLIHHYPTGIIYKVGDDLRQDRLALQLIEVCDSILKAKGHDMKLTLYKVFNTSATEGIIEFVPDSYPLSTILEQNSHDICRYLRLHNFDITTENNISRVAWDNFIKSTAGYCVISYLLGFGDRHLDNLLLRKTGEFFHIDFAFLFGHDPKPFPPLVRLPPEMVTAMGGVKSNEFTRFLILAGKCFNILRKEYRLFISILRLMADAEIPDLKEDRILIETEKRFLPNATKSQASQFIKEVIKESQNTKTKAQMTLMEKIHHFSVSLK